MSGLHCRWLLAGSCGGVGVHSWGLSVFFAFLLPPFFCTCVRLPHLACWDFARRRQVVCSMGDLLEMKQKEVLRTFFSLFDWWDVFVCVCVPACVLILRLHDLERTTFSLYCIYTWTGPGPPLTSFCPRGCSLPALQPCWCLGGSSGMKNPPFRPQPRVFESFRRSLQLCCGP